MLSRTIVSPALIKSTRVHHDLRVVSEFNLASVAKFPEPPELVIRRLSLSIAVQINLRVGPGVIRVITSGVKVRRTACYDVAGGWANVAVVAGDGRIFPLSIGPTSFVNLDTGQQLFLRPTECCDKTYIPSDLLAAPNEL